MKKPGMPAFAPFAAATFQHSDSLEGLLRHPLNLTATYDAYYGTPRRGNFVYEVSDDKVAPIGVAEIVVVNGVGDYDVVFYADVKVNDEVTVLSADGTSKATGKVASVSRVTTDVRGLTSGVDAITITFNGGEVEPAEPALIIFTAADGKAPAGIVYESSLNHDFSLAIDVDGARLNKVFGGETEWVKSLGGVRVAHNLLFFSIKG